MFKTCPVLTGRDMHHRLIKYKTWGAVVILTLLNFHFTGGEVPVQPFQPELGVDSLRCPGDGSGRIRIRFRDGNPGCLCILSTDSLFGKQLRRTAFNQDALIQFDSLAAGTYYLMFRIKGGSMERRRVQVYEPQALKPGTIEKLKGTSGAGAKDAVLRARPEGGTAPYSFQWGPEAGNQTGEIASNLIEGVQRCLITDSRQCGPVQAVYFLSPDEPVKSEKDKTAEKK
ncbi:MAG: hypothetical protein U0T82_04975 [Bacteroidales bacterium]